MQDALNKKDMANYPREGFSTQEAKAKLPQVLPKPLMINLGCGADVRDGFLNLDLYSDNPRVIYMDIRNLEFENNSVDFILASDILEHFSHRETASLLKEWARVLKPGGEILIRCPNLKMQAEKYLQGTWDADIASYMIFGGQTNAGDYHCIGFDEKSIKKHLEAAGFEVTHYEEEDLPQDQTFINLNMIVRAKKKDLKIDQENDNLSLFLENTETIKDDIKTESAADVNSIDDFDFELNDTPEQEIKSTEAIRSEAPYINVVWEGSQFVYHSFALVNREFCTNLIDSGQVNLSIIPFEKDEFAPHGNEKYEKLMNNDIRFKPDAPEEIGKLPYCWIRHQWPPNGEVPKGAKWIVMQPWEFSHVRKDDYKIYEACDEIWTPSTVSRQAFVNSGIDYNKVQVIPNGIDPELFTPDGEKYPLKTDKKFKILFVGGTIPRKGIDILIEAYKHLFKRTDDVCLVIKDFGGKSFYRGINAKQKIEEFMKDPEFPEIIYIDDALSEEEMASLYRSCNIFASPYRGEGFSLPTLEAMACGLPVLVTAGGATDDFVDEDSGWLIPADTRDMGNKVDDFELMGEAYMLDPKVDTLAALLKDLYLNPNILISKGLVASYRARKFWTWRRSTLKMLARLDDLYDTSMARNAEEIIIEYSDSALSLAEGEKHFSEFEFDEAKNHFQNALFGIESQEYKILAYTRLAFINVYSEEYENAQQYLNLAKKIDENHPDCLYLDTLIHLKLERNLEGLEEITKLVNGWNNDKFRSAFDHTLDGLLVIMGEMMIYMEDYISAIQVYQAALKYNPENAEACFGSAVCLENQGNYADALTMYEWALKHDEDNEHAQEAIERINSMMGEKE